MCLMDVSWAQTFHLSHKPQKPQLYFGTSC